MHLKHRLGGVLAAIALAGTTVVSSPAPAGALTGQVSDIINFTGFFYETPATARTPASGHLTSNTCLLVSDGEPSTFFKCTVAGTATPSASGGVMVVTIKSDDGNIVFRENYDNALGTVSGTLSETDADSNNCTTYGTGAGTFSTQRTRLPHLFTYKGSITVTDNPPVGLCDPDDIPHGASSL
ncbi:MAG TPA: hypothetical protein VHT75_16230 [Acidimicrobiales bacterium]|jgi:hypothetical protein|nr:hypothetical protein [Acidimicrobiales bacterium]